MQHVQKPIPSNRRFLPRVGVCTTRTILFRRHYFGTELTIDSYLNAKIYWNRRGSERQRERVSTIVELVRCANLCCAAETVEMEITIIIKWQKWHLQLLGIGITMPRRCITTLTRIHYTHTPPENNTRQYTNTHSGWCCLAPKTAYTNV